MYKYFSDNVVPALCSFQDSGVPVTCFNAQQCQLCKNDHPRLRVYSVDGPDFDELWKHMVEYYQLYTCDGKMYYEMLPLKNGQCRQCKTNLALDEHTIEANLNPGEPYTLAELQHAHDRFMHHFLLFARKHQSEHLVLLSETVSTEALNLFYNSSNFKDFENEYVDGVGTNPAKLGDRYKGFLVDPVTPLHHYLVDTLHFGIIIANIVMNSVILPLVQQIEDCHPGLGIVAFYIACKASGLKHLGARMKRFADVNCKNVAHVVESAQEIANAPGRSPNARIVKLFVTKYVPKWTVGQLRKALSQLHPGLGDAVKRMSKDALIKETNHQFLRVSDEEIVTNWIPPLVLEEITNSIAFAQAEAMVVGSENTPLELGTIAKSAGVKLQGRDEKTLLENGGAEIMIKLLNIVHTNAVISNNEALTKLIKRLTSNDQFFDTKVEEKKLAIKKMLELKQVGVLDMTFENQEECEGDFNAVFAAIETENEHYDEYRDEAIKISNSLLSLYTTSDGNAVELDPMAQQAMDVVLALKKIVLPIIHPSSDDVDKMKEELEPLETYIRNFLPLLKSDRWTIDFGTHSLYVHWMIAHAKEDCLRSLECWGRHLSFFSCQTSEHFNKVLKRCVERLHGFTHRSVNPDFPLRNNFGFVMHETQLCLYYYFDTISSTRYQSCTKCRKTGHNRRTCQAVCFDLPAENT